MKQTVREFWWSSDISRQLPLRKKVKHGLPTFLLECSYSTAYRRFKKEYPMIKLGYVTFVQLRPKNVRHMKVMERIVCCCIKCQNIKLKVQAINRTAKWLNKPNLQLPLDEPEISSFTMCETENRLPDPKCIDRKCDLCGPDKVAVHLQPLLDNNSDETTRTDEWRRVQKTKTVRGQEKTFTVTELVSRDIELSTVVQELQDKLIPFTKHLFRAQWQQN